MRENLMSGSMWQGMETRTSKSQALSLDPTSRLGVHAAFSGIFRGLKLVPAKRRYLVPLQAANAHHWAGHDGEAT